MTEPKTPAPKIEAPKVAPKIEAPKVEAPEWDIVTTIDYGPVFLALIIGLAIGVGVYYVLTHVMIEDTDNA